MSPGRTRWLLRATAFAVLLLVWGVPTRSAQAQVLIALLLGDKVSNERFQLGLNVSFAATGFWGVPAKFKPGWSIAMYGEIRLSDHFHLQPELVMKAPGAAQEMEPGIPGFTLEPIGDPTYDDVISTGQLTREIRYIALPILAKGVFGPVGLTLGPQLGVLLTADDTVAKKVGESKVRIEQSVTDQMQRIDVGIAGGVEYAFSPSHGMRSMRVRARGYLGLVDTVKNNPQDPIRNWNFSVGLDIPIGGSSKPKPKPEPGAGGEAG